MKTIVTMTLTCADGDARRGLASVLAPDNEGAPRGLKLSVGGRGRQLKVSVESESPSTAVSTVLGFLRDVALFQEVWLLSHGRDARSHRGRP